MKKTMILSTLGMLLASPMVLADVTLYGKAHMAIESTNPDGGDSSTDLVSRDSRLGVKGKAEIGDGLYGIFKYELGVDLDGSSPKNGDFLSQRNQFVGLKGNFGKVIAGIHDTPLKQLEGKDLFGDTYADIGKVLDHYVDAQERESHFLGYYSPKFNGAQFAIATMPGKGSKDANGDTVDGEIGDAYSMSVLYGDKKLKKGNFYAGLAYDDAVDGKNTSLVRLTGGAKFGSFAVRGLVEQADDGSDNQMRYMINGAYKIGSNKLKLQYVDAEKVGSKKASDQISLGFERKLGKQTSMYVHASKQDLEGQETTFGSVGLIQKF